MPRGNALPPATDAQSELTPTDVDLAKDEWKKVAPPGFKNLLDAELTEEERANLTTEG